jgi:hypothetical protein
MKQIPNPPKGFESWCNFYAFIEKNSIGKELSARISTHNNEAIELDTTLGVVIEYAFLEMWRARLMPDDIRKMQFAINNASIFNVGQCNIFLNHMLKCRFHL